MVVPIPMFGLIGSCVSVTGAVGPGESVFDAGADTAIGFGVNGAQVAQIDVNGIPKFSGNSRVISNVSKTSSTTLGAITGLTATLRASKHYAFRIVLFTTAGASGGIRVSLGGGTATLTSSGTIIWNALSSYNYGAGLCGSSPNNTTLTANVDCGAGALQVQIVIEGEILVGTTGGGTLIPQFAQSVSNGTATTVLAGSNMKVWEIN